MRLLTELLPIEGGRVSAHVKNNQEGEEWSRDRVHWDQTLYLLRDNCPEETSLGRLFA